MKKLIAYAASECQPFFTSGGLADVIGSLPKSIINTSNDYDIIVFLPLYKSLNKDFINKFDLLYNLKIKLSWRNLECNIYSYTLNNIKYYFIDNEYYFQRDKLYGYFDDVERFAFFSKACIEFILKEKLNIDIIHCHDWQTGMLLVYLSTIYYHEKLFFNTKRIFTIHNIEYQGIYSFDSDILENVFGIDHHDGYLLEYNGQVNIMKGAMECANIVSTVSPSYALEIKTSQYAHNLEYEVNRVYDEGKLFGILNGIDYEFYNPILDKSLFNNYDFNSIDRKVLNKEELQKLLGLNVNKDIPLYGMVTRLVWHKGLEILKRALPDLLKEDLQLVLLGTGDSYYENFLKEMENRFPTKLKVILAFNQDLSRKIYSGIDFFIMPSESEPCGLSQMIASRYGAIPLVRETGGLKDSIRDFSLSNGNGFTFSTNSEKDFIGMVKRSIHLFKSDDLNKCIKDVMQKDFSWQTSAKEYIKLYSKLIK